MPQRSLEDHAADLERLTDTVLDARDGLRRGFLPDMPGIEEEVVSFCKIIKQEPPDTGAALQSPLRRLIAAFSELSAELEEFVADGKAYIDRHGIGS